jgi:dephospho-CoA kinase
MVFGIVGRKYTGKSTLVKELLHKGFCYYDINTRMQHILNTDQQLIEKTVKLFSNRVYVNETFSYKAALPYMITDDDYLHRHYKNIADPLFDDFQLFLDRMIHKQLFLVEGPILEFQEISQKIQYLIGLECNTNILYNRIKSSIPDIKDMEIDFILSHDDPDIEICNTIFNTNEKNWLNNAKNDIYGQIKLL